MAPIWFPISLLLFLCILLPVVTLIRIFLRMGRQKLANSLTIGLIGVSILFKVFTDQLLRKLLGSGITAKDEAFLTQGNYVLLLGLVALLTLLVMPRIFKPSNEIEKNMLMVAIFLPMLIFGGLAIWFVWSF